MVPEDRLDQIKAILSVQKSISANELGKKLYVSPSTIRRDLIELEKMGIVRRTHGGAVLIAESSTVFAYAVRSEERHEEKEKIARSAANFINDDMTIFMDSSSTVGALSKYVYGKRNLTVITNGLDLAASLRNSENTHLYLAGGHIKPLYASIMGEQTLEFLQNFRADLAIMSCKNLDTKGFYEAEYSVASLKRVMINNSDRTLLLVDGTKFDESSSYKIGNLAKLSLIITESDPGEAYHEKNTGVPISWEGL